MARFFNRRTGSPSNRPVPGSTGIQSGEIAIGESPFDTGIYIKDISDNIVKIGPTFVGGAAPNATPIGQAGNSVGELWWNNILEELRIWDGSTWALVNSGGGGGTDTRNFVTEALYAFDTMGAFVESIVPNVRTPVFSFYDPPEDGNWFIVDYTVGGDTFTASSTVQTTIYGDIRITTGGSLFFTPAPNLVGTLPVTYRIEEDDLFNFTQEARLNINVLRNTQDLTTTTTPYGGS